MSETIMLNDFDLIQYLIEPQEDLENKIDEIDKLIQQLGGPYGENALKSEYLSLNDLRTQKSELTYRELNLEFLKLNRQITKEGYEYNVPRFTVYGIFDENIFEFSGSSYYAWFGEYTLNLYFPKLPKIYLKPLIESIISPDEIRPINFSWSHYSIRNKKVYEKFRGREKTFEAEFNGIIPTKTKENIEKSLDTFRKEELYFIVETKPEEWTYRRITRDPLVTGVIGNRVFLIDSFDTTIAEKYVKENWTK